MSIVALSAMTSVVAAAYLCIGVASLRRLFAPSQLLSIVTQRQSIDVNRPQNTLLDEKSVGSSEVGSRHQAGFACNFSGTRHESLT
jgi:hypothetical protein